VRRYTHGHSLALGVLLCLLVQRNGWLVLICALLVFVAGWVAHSIRARIGRGARALGGLVAARVETERERRRAVRAGTRLKVEKARELRSDREKRERKAYMMGAIDGGKS